MSETDASQSQQHARFSVLLAAAGVLFGIAGYLTGTTDAAGILAIPLGLVVGHDACIAVHGDKEGIKGYVYVFGGVAVATALQYGLVT